MTTKPVVRHSLRNKNDVILLHCMVPLYDKLSSVIIAETLFSYIPQPVYCDLILHWYTFSYIAVQCNNVLFAHAHPTMFYYKFLLGTLPWYIESQRHRCTHTLTHVPFPKWIVVYQSMQDVNFPFPLQGYHHLISIHHTCLCNRRVHGFNCVHTWSVSNKCKRYCYGVLLICSKDWGHHYTFCCTGMYNTLYTNAFLHVNIVVAARMLNV